MGRIADLLRKNEPTKDFVSEAVRRGQRLWRESFGEDKEKNNKKDERPPVVRGGSYGRSMIAQPEAFKRLLQAMRSMAPGGWTDDRWEQTKHFVGIQYITIHRIGEQMAQASFRIYEKDPDSSDPEAVRPAKSKEAEDLYRILEEPNPDDSFGDLIYCWNQQMDLTGMALTWMVPNMFGVPYELYPVPTAIAIPQPAINPDYPDGYYRIQPLYPYGPFSSYPTPSTAVGAPIPAQWMLRFKYPHPLVRYDGYAPLTGLRLHLDEVESMDRSRWYSMKRTINPSAVLNFKDFEGAEPLPEAEIERIRTEFENTFQGPENAGQLFVSTPGAELEPWGMTPKEMEYHQSWEQLVSFVMAGFGITKEAAGMISDSSYSTLYATLKQLHLLTIEPKVKRISDKLTRHLARRFGKNLIIKIHTRRIDDHDVERSDAETLITGKAITKNELRQKLDMHPTKESWGGEIAGYEEPELVDPITGLPIEGVQQEGAVGEEGAGSAIFDQHGQAEPRSEEERDLSGEEPKQIGNNRPRPGPMGRGALGPRKSFKSLRHVFPNGNAKKKKG